MLRTHLSLLLAAALAAAPSLAETAPSAQPEAEPAQRSQRAERKKGPAEDTLQAPTEPQVAWFGRWADAKAEAARTGRPILLMSAAPQCQGKPGVW